ncbi:MAG: creatininase family protein [Deltaproteobacteria bacterium]|nr:creatininase family protein [Deltaproteobacteria bacterium]
MSGTGAAGDHDPLEVLAVILRLEVGPVTLTPRRLTCPYRVTTAAGTESLDLVYKYEEEVFDPFDPAHRNLAAVMAAQPALNYGLFCQEMVFHDPLDQADRRLFRDMAANTAREIYVKKLLEPNPFLTGPARGLPALKRSSYLRAKMVFPSQTALTPTAPWGRPEAGAAVLSSGGKESLLSFALLREMGRPVHPVFINEAGRHWFTALRAYRHFQAHEPLTSRVWTNSDRLFAWMLRRLSFIRPDFASLRADIYPLRLWTVAVLIFGALPLLKKRGLARLVVGDEFDTTSRTSSHGITHYDGLYDQSIYFDHALSRYYQAKGWRVQQFSLLRPLSELLVEKILVERYPAWQTLQVSCHASHLDQGRVAPCGRCEKCRRVVGMLAALGADPEHCGYAPAQVAHCLADLTKKGVHQEAVSAEQMLFLLEQKGLLPPPGQGKPRRKPRPEAQKLRFDPVRSPLETIPRDLRRPLFRILLAHAQGAVRRMGRVWLDFDPLNDPGLDHPYPFEGPSRPGPAGPGGRPDPARSHLWGELSWPGAARRLGEVDLALLPVGAIEQHGPHLPLDTDAYDAWHLAEAAARACATPRPLVLPLIPYGVSYHHEDFPGTIAVSPDTLSKMVYEVGLAAARHGVVKLVIVNGHGGNGPALHFAAQMINRDAKIFTCVESGETSDSDIDQLVETPNDVHAGETETSTALATRPELVDLGAARTAVPRFTSRFLDFSSRRSVTWYAHTAKLSASGVLGDPSKASVAKGERIWDLMISRLVEFVEHLKGLTLEEIHQRRY